MSVPGIVVRVQDAAPGLAAHLADRYGIEPAHLVELDQGVFRVERHDGGAWVARVFPNHQPADVLFHASLLRSLEKGRFPAERCAHADAVTDFAGSPVLVTDWVEGTRANGRGRTFGVLGALLGRLHSHAGESLRPGGAWHHLAPRGGPREEIDAAIDLLESIESETRPELHHLYDDVRNALEELNDCHDLPHGIVHPDFVPSNAIATPDDRRVIIDWSGSGRGPRLWSLAFFLWAGGIRDLRLVDLAITRYAKSIDLEPAELARLEAVIPGRPLTMDVWSFTHGRTTLEEVARNLRANRAAASRIRDRIGSALGE